MSSEGGTKKVLVIDDNPTIVELIKYAVNLQGTYQVIVAYDGAQGLERIRVEQPDCVIIDMGVLQDHYRLMRYLRAGTKEVRLPLIVLDTVTRSESQIASLLLETDEHLKKPFKPSALSAAIDRILRQR